jgi:thioredoxin 1
VADIATQYAGRVKVGKVDVDEAGRTAADFRITSVPTLLIFKNGAVVQEIVGAVPKSKIVEALDRALAR